MSEHAPLAAATLADIEARRINDEDSDPDPDVAALLAEVRRLQGELAALQARLAPDGEQDREAAWRHFNALNGSAKQSGYPRGFDDGFGAALRYVREGVT